MPGFKASTMFINWPLRPSLSVVEDPWNIQLLVSKLPNTGPGWLAFHISNCTSMPAAGHPRAVSKTWVVMGGRVLVEACDVLGAGDAEAEVKCAPMMLTRSSII